MTGNTLPRRQDPLYSKRWHLDRARGIKRLVDPAAAREHAQRLHAAGFTWNGIADVAGLAATTVTDLAAGRYNQVNRRVAAAILRIDITTAHARTAQTGLVLNVGTHRRVRALLALGWTHKHMQAESGVITAVLLHQEGSWITRRKHEAVKAMYERLSGHSGPSEVTRQRAVRLGYELPAQWDDDTIDDPESKPACRRGPEAKQRKRAEVVADAWDLVRTSETAEQIAVRLGLTWDGLERALRREGQHQLIDLLRTDPHLRVIAS